jgi:ATP-binding cassette, subfamily B, bacterial
METLKKQLRLHWKIGLGVLALASVNQIFSLIDPLIFRTIIDEYASQPESYTSREFFIGVGLLLLLAIGIVLISRIAKNFQDYYLNKMSQRIGATLYQDGVAHVLKLPYQAFENTRSGEILGLLQKARTDTERYLSTLINVVFISLVGFLFVSIYAVTVFWGVAIAYALTIPLIGGASLLLTKKLKKVQSEITAETAALSGSTTESLRNIELVKSLGLSEQEINRLNTTTEKILDLELKKLRYVRSISFIQGSFINLMRNAILLFLLYLVFAGRITFGEFFSLYIYSFFVFGPLQELGNMITAHREAEASLERLNTLLAQPTEIVRPDAEPLASITSVHYRDVSFRYTDQSRDALHRLSWEARAGETVAFVGPSGSGKTTLVKLLVGLYEPTGGSLSYNTILSTSIQKDSLRAHIGLVTQDTQLFAGSIRENLLFVNPDASEERMHEVLKKSACDTLMKRAQEGLDTLIGEGGVKLSGGEKQRLSIARALLRNPSLLIFDEATSALDSLTEEEITKTVRELSSQQSHITVLIAHRLSTIMHADRIYVLEKGKLTESGNHHELVAQGGLYAAMWRQQSGELRD